MKKLISTAAVAMMLAAVMGSCADKSAKERVAEQRRQWEASLTDSIATVRRQTDSVKSRLEALRSETDRLLGEFRCVDNPREVEKYYLPSVAGYSYPLTTTGLGARLMANEQLELVAVLAGPRFTGISISSGDMNARTHNVAPDQALNYRSGNITTVAFSGKDIDSIASSLAEIEGKVRVTYFDGDRKVGETTLSEPQTKALVLAGELAGTRRETLLSEKRLMLLGRKLSMLESREETKNNEETE